MSDLIDRLAAVDAPLALDREVVVGRGRRIVRRRRAAGLGTALAGLLVAGSLWWGVTGDPHAAVAPASVMEELETPQRVEFVDKERGDVGDVVPLTLGRQGDDVVATYAVAGREEKVVGQRLGDGALVFPGEKETVVVWPGHHPGVALANPSRPTPEDYSYQNYAEIRVGGEPFTWLTLSTVDRPADVIIRDGNAVWTATGATPDVESLESGGYEVTVAGLPAYEAAALFENRSRLTMTLVPGLNMVQLTRQGWFGGTGAPLPLVNAPRAAVDVREIVRPAPDVEDAMTQEWSTRLLADRSVALLGEDPAGLREERDHFASGEGYYEVEWSAGDDVWFPAGDPAPRELQVGAASAAGGHAVGPGGELDLAGIPHRVGISESGWPRLIQLGDGWSSSVGLGPGTTGEISLERPSLLAPKVVHVTTSTGDELPSGTGPVVDVVAPAGTVHLRILD